VPQLEPGHHPPATPSRAPPRRKALNELKPPAAFRIAASRTQLRRPGPGPVGDLDPDCTVPGNDRDRDRPPGAAEPLCRTLLVKTSLTSKTATSPHGCPGPSISLTKARAARARSARPASVTLSRTATLAITAPALRCPHQPGEVSEPPGGHTRMHARLGAARQAWTTRPRGPSVAVRETADGAHRPSQLCTPTVVTVHADRRKCARRAPLPHGRPSAMRPWTAQHHGLQRYKVTRAGTEEKRPASARIRS
jgi:hypothetical protein